MRRSGRGHANRAFTLIEALMACAILSVGAAALIQCYGTIMGIAIHQRHLAVGVHVAQAKLEELLIADSGSAVMTTRNAVQFVDDLGRRLRRAGRSAYEVRWTVAPNTPSPGFMLVTVKSVWNEPAGVRSTELSRFRPE